MPSAAETCTVPVPDPFWILVPTGVGLSTRILLSDFL